MASHDMQREFRRKYSLGAYKSEQEYIAHVNTVKKAIASKKYLGLKVVGTPDLNKERKDKGYAR